MVRAGRPVIKSVATKVSINAAEAGMYAEAAAETAVTGGSFALSEGQQKAFAGGGKTGTELDHDRGVKGVTELHHVNPLQSGLLPTAPLPAAVRHSRANLKILSLAEHRAAHRLLAQQEKVLATAFNPATTFGRVAYGAGAECGCP